MKLQATFRFAIATAISILANTSFATNGVNLIGLSPTSLGMGGTGTGHFTSGADALYKNPALLGVSPTAVNHLTGDLFFTYGKQPTKGQAATGSQDTGMVDNLASGRVIPDLAATYRLNNDIVLGLGVLAYSGVGSDNAGQALVNEVQTNMSQVRVIPSVSYKIDDRFYIGAAPIIGYGEFELNYSVPGLGISPRTTRAPHGATALGFEVGAYAAPVDNLTVGASFISKTSFTYKDLANFDVFGPKAGDVPPVNTSELHSLNIQQPAEFSVGAAYQVCPELKVAADYRWIGWGNADGYKDFGFKNQSVFAVGAQYKWKQASFRVGFNYSASPLEDATGEAGGNVVDLQGHSVFQYNISKLDMFGFQAITQTHLTVGTGYQFTDQLNADLGFMFAPRVTVTRAGTTTAVPGAPSGFTYSYTAQATQFAIAGGATYQF